MLKHWILLSKQLITLIWIFNFIKTEITHMKKSLFLVICLIIIVSFSACSGNNTQQNDYNSEITENNSLKSQQETLSFNGVDYLINSSLDFEVKDTDYEEDDNITYVTFYNCIFDSDGTVDVSMEGNVFESVTFVYFGNYGDVCSLNTKILGSSKIYNRSTDSEELIESYQIIYDENCNMIMKADTYMAYFSCYENYYDSEYQSIATLHETDMDTGVKWIDSNGNIIDEDGLYSLIEDLCPNEYLFYLI